MIRFSASVELQAAAGNGPRRLAIVAYNGAEMTVDGFGPVVVDLAGMHIAGSVPILVDHENKVSAIAGTGSASTDGKSLIVAGTVADSAAGRAVVALLESGAQLQASIGCDPMASARVDAGATLTANGRSIKAGKRGFVHVQKSALKEISIVALGADGTSSVSLAAHRAGKVRPMKTFEEYVESLELDPAALTDGQRAKLQAQFTKQAEPEETPATAAQLVSIMAGCPQSLQLRAANEQWSESRIKSEALSHLRAQRPGYGVGVLGGTGDHGATEDHIAAGLLIRCGYHAAAEKAYPARVMEQVRAGKLDRMSLTDSVTMAARLNGVTGDIDTMLRASTLSLSNVLANVLGKMLENTWQASPKTWGSWCAPRVAKDFKAQSAVRVSHIDGVTQYAEGGELSHGYLTDNAIAWQVYSFGRILTMPRTTIINDDLNALAEVPMGMAMAAERSTADLIYATLMADASTNFSAGHGNVLTSGTSALSASSLTTAIKQLRVQTAPNGSPLNIPPATLVVPPTLEQTARALLQSNLVLRDQTSDKQPMGNTFLGVANLEVEPRLELGCTSPIIGSSAQTGSAAKWYLFGGPQYLPAIVGFLRTGNGPIVEAAGPDYNFNMPGQSYRVLLDVGFSLGDYRAAQRAAGA